MKKFSLLFALFLIGYFVQAQNLSYYLPKNVVYNSAIPTPANIIGHEVGEWHVTHDRLVQYAKTVDQASDRMILKPLGLTNEGRQQLALIITSPENHQKLEQIRLQHLALTNPDNSNSMNTDDMPVVVWMGYSIHGNESSGANASLLAMYYLAAAQGSAVDALLKNTVIILDPSLIQMD